MKFILARVRSASSAAVSSSTVVLTMEMFTLAIVKLASGSARVSTTHST